VQSEGVREVRVVRNRIERFIMMDGNALMEVVVAGDARMTMFGEL